MFSRILLFLGIIAVLVLAGPTIIAVGLAFGTPAAIVAAVMLIVLALPEGEQSEEKKGAIKKCTSI
jgi:uncharacterized membrane protein YhaH (DUF805 family)